MSAVVESWSGQRLDAEAEVAIVGAGACGTVAGLAAAGAGCEVVLLERDAAPAGSTALSSGMVPAAGTRAQRAAGVDDSPARMAADIRAKAGGALDEAVLAAVCEGSAPTLEWLGEAHGVALELVEGFLYPGHSRARMHAPPSRTGAELIGALTSAAAAAELTLLTSARAETLLAEPDGRVRALRYRRPDGTTETLGCRALVLACNGYGGNPERIARHIPTMADAVYFGHRGNQGDALAWGEALGAQTASLGAFQGHGSLAHPHGILITWALMMEGAVQINARGERFSNEHDGYSEQARRVIEQPGGVAWVLHDERLHALGSTFEDYRRAVDARAVREAPDVKALARLTGAPAEVIARTLDEVAACAAGRRADRFGRDFTNAPGLAAPYRAVRVTGALFHTQGGLVVDAGARVLRADGLPLPNLLAGGGAARGLSGEADHGYLSGNGLLTAMVLGRLAGRGAARIGGARSEVA